MDLARCRELLPEFILDQAPDRSICRIKATILVYVQCQSFKTRFQIVQCHSLFQGKGSDLGAHQTFGVCKPAQLLSEFICDHPNVSPLGNLESQVTR